MNWKIGQSEIAVQDNCILISTHIFGIKVNLDFALSPETKKVEQIELRFGEVSTNLQTKEEYIAS